MRRVFFLVVIVAMASISNVRAQDYKTALGIKFYPGAVSVKHFVNDKGAIEGLGYFWKYGTRITGLYEYHMDIKDLDGLKWYVGGGAFFDIYSYKGGYGGYGNTSFGINAVGGVDYKFKTIPLNLSADWMPSILFGNNLYYSSNFRPGYGAVSVRYVLK